MNKSIIEKEIEWCERNIGTSGDSIRFELGFIMGLKQALFLLNKKKEKEEDEKLHWKHWDRK